MAFTVMSMILRLEPSLVAVVLFFLCSIGSMSRSRREKAPVPSAKVYGVLFATCSIVFFAYSLVFGGYEYSHAHFVRGETGNTRLMVVMRYVVWAGFHAAMNMVFWRVATRTEDAAEMFRRLTVSASSLLGMVFPVALAQYMIRYRFSSEICARSTAILGRPEGSAWCDLDESIRSVEESWKWSGSAWVGANDDWETVVEWAIRVREYHVSEHRAETAAVAIVMGVLAALLPKQAAEDVKLSVRCLETVGLSTLEYAYGLMTLAMLLLFTCADVYPTPLGWVLAGASGIASATLWCVLTDRRKQLADLKKSKELAAESPEEETAKLRMHYAIFSFVNLGGALSSIWFFGLFALPQARDSLKNSALTMILMDIDMPWKFALWHSMKSLRLDTVKGSTWVVLLATMSRHYMYFWAFDDSSHSAHEYGRSNVYIGRIYFYILMLPELVVQVDLWKNWRMDSRRFFWKTVPALIPYTVYVARLTASAIENRFGYHGELDTIGAWVEVGNRCTKLAGLTGIAYGSSTPHAVLRDVIMRKLLDNIAGIAMFQIIMLATTPMVLYAFSRIHLSIPRLQNRSIACREYFCIAMWAAFYVIVLGHFASKKLALPMLLLKVSASWSTAYCICKVKDSNIGDELRRTTMESRTSRLTRSLRASMAHPPSAAREAELPRVLDRPSTKVGPDGRPLKETSGTKDSQASGAEEVMQ